MFNMKLKAKALLLCTALVAAVTTNAQTPVYLDESKPVDQRIEDALQRMTLQEKINIIHAQSKFSSPGVARLGIPEVWTDDGPHGVRPDVFWDCLLYTSPSPRDVEESRMPSSA